MVPASAVAGAEGEVPRTGEVVVTEEEETGERVAMMCCSCVDIVSCEKKYILLLLFLSSKKRCRETDLKRAQGGRKKGAEIGVYAPSLDVEREPLSQTRGEAIKVVWQQSKDDYRKKLKPVEGGK